MVLYASFTSLIAVPSGETTGYVRVITEDTEAADWSYWMKTTVLESKQWTAASTPQKFHTVAVSQLHALRKVAHSLQTCLRCCLLHLGNDVMELVIIFYIASLTGAMT